MSAWKAILNCSWKFEASDFFLKATLLFWQLSIDSMLLLLSLSSTEKQEAQNQFGQGMGVGGSWQGRVLFPAVGSGPREEIRDHTVSFWAAPLSILGHTEKFFCACGISRCLLGPVFLFYLILF